MSTSLKLGDVFVVEDGGIVKFSSVGDQKFKIFVGKEEADEASDEFMLAFGQTVTRTFSPGRYVVQVLHFAVEKVIYLVFDDAEDIVGLVERSSREKLCPHCKSVKGFFTVN